MNNQPLRGPGSFDRDRDIIEQQRQRADEMAHREREQTERAHRDAYHPSMPPHHSSAGSIPIHQPVASRLAGAIHSPGGLLANHGSSSAIPLGAPSGSVPNFGGPLHEQGNRPPAQHQASQGNPTPQHQLFGPMPMPHAAGPPAGPHGAPSGPQALFGGPLQTSENQAPVPQSQGPPGAQPGAAQQGGAGPMPQGQQPILNDALTYLDQVKVQFHDQPDVYNRFLDIMKDFKSQSIDTPGVINRVSELFAGHPNLIQGFNTFLPPGYRIECGAGNDPNTIRVTTPMGTTVQSIAGRGTQADSHAQVSGRNPFFNHRQGNWAPQVPQHTTDGQHDPAFSAPPQNGPGVFGQGQTQGPPFEAPGAGQARVSSQPHNAPVPAPGPGPGPGPRNAHTPTPSGVSGAVTAGAAQLASEKRGPVEFNHAISYVNKIKNRFQDKPEIYKQFLEILQTYQRESKAISDVYSQVTTLFHTAPDLLEDFKQFLPDVTGQKTTPSRTGEDGTPAPGAMHTPQTSSLGGPKMPPLGSFAPPASASKEPKKRPRNEKQTTNSAASPAEITPTVSRSIATSGVHKKPKLMHKALASDVPAIEPTLTPVMPEPIAPPSAAMANQEEMAFLERVKKYLGNRTSMNEFLKLCNLFSQQIIDLDTFYQNGCNYLSGNQELLASWKSLLQYEPRDVFVDNVPAPPTGKISLSNCRGYGPSYRLLPRRERLKPCSGRDELCMSVLNDDWASHPTWASEDSGFVAHRKNAYEEGLHRIEEERHDYDFNIEANLKCIQLLEPIAQQMLLMTPAEQEQFRMPTALAGQTTSIFKRVCKKLYGEKGIDVVNDLFSHPFSVLPVLLARLKQKDEEWRFSQREWSKVWHSQTENMHLKSLDHMGILVKQTDKRQLSAKHLVDVIKTKHEEQRRERLLNGTAPRHQFQWSFADKDVTLDLLRLMALYAIHNSQHSNTEKERIWDFFVYFIPTFFDLDDAKVQERIPKFQVDSGEEDGDDPSPLELTNGRSRRNGKRGDLLRGVLDPGRNTTNRSRASKDGSASGSKETTPDVASGNEDETPEVNEDQALSDSFNDRWMPNIPRPTILKPGEDEGLLPSDGDLRADGNFQRRWYNFFCNQTIFVFFSIFQTLHQRLREVKQSEESVTKSIARVYRPRPATDIGLMEPPKLHFEATDTPDLYWPKTMELIEEYIMGDIDEARYQEVLRHFYLSAGWKLYTIQDLIRTLCRLALTCSSVDGKEKTYDLIKQFLTSREREETSYQAEISARKFAEKCVRDGELFVICWLPNKSEASVRWLQREETTFYMDDMKLQERWQYYISSYVRVEPTEGVPRSKLSKAVLTRNLPSPDGDLEDASAKPLSYDENLLVSICMRTSKMVWGAGSSDSFFYNKTPTTKEEKETRDKAIEMSTLGRAYRLKEKFVMNNSWMKDLSQEEVEGHKAEYKRWAEEGVLPGEAAPETADVDMAG